MTLSVPESRIRVLTLVDYYVPGFKAGGALRSVSNLVDHLQGEFQFLVVTRDRDAGDRTAYHSVQVNEWQAVNGATVFYVAGGLFLAYRLTALLRRTKYDVLYLNSLLSPQFTLLVLALRRLGLLPAAAIIIAPRGEASSGALATKRWKKLPFLAAAKVLRLYSGLTWQASTTIEAEDIHRHFATVAKSIVVAPDIAATNTRRLSKQTRRPKQAGSLDVVFLSRITAKKNLLGALRCLAGVRGTLKFDIYGPREDVGYWAECERALSRLPSNIEAHYLGVVDPSDVPRVMSSYHLFFLPTHSENFGHVIVEAISAGTPVLISDATPWQHLAARRVGWDLPVDDEAGFRAALQEMMDMNQEGLSTMSDAATRYAAAIHDNDAVDQNRQLLRSRLRPRDVPSHFTASISSIKP